MNLENKINKLYEENNQHLYIHSECVRNKKKGEDIIDIWVGSYDKNEIFQPYGLYLFSILNIKAFEECGNKYNFDCYFRDNPNILRKVDLVEVYNRPLYCNQVFTLKTYKKIKDKEIMQCLDYYLNKVIDCFWIWNMEIIDE